ncbi:WD40 repeat-like protein [Phellopilus nigrolimitatus]|nr:WD40 repeat-like protein [Phellopilus nigrolimitatus]
MHLARHSIAPTAPIQVLDARFDADARIFTAATPHGFAVYRTWPLELLRKHEFAEDGTLTTVLPMHTSSLLFLVGGGASPRYPPNKVVVWDAARAREVAELEFRERVRGLACRRGWLVVALRRRAVAFEVGAAITRVQEWDTCDNQRGLVAIATAAHATLLAIAGRQTGHVQLVHLPPCRAPAPTVPPPTTTTTTPPRRTPAAAPKPAKHPVSIIAAHTAGLATLTVLPSGRLLATTSARGTLLRVWDAHSGKLVREFRRGSDKAEIYGVAFRPDEQDVCVWSDKGTVHVFSLSVGAGSSNRQSALSPLAPFLSLPRWIDSEWSYAQYRIPAQKNHIALSASTAGSKLSEAVEDERCVVAWVEVPPPPGKEAQQPEYQMIALTFSGGWYRLALPASASVHSPARASFPAAGSSAASHSGRPTYRPRSSSGSSVLSGRTRADKGKERETEREEKVGHECSLQEFRRYGRWDGWG